MWGVPASPTAADGAEADPAVTVAGCGGFHRPGLAADVAVVGCALLGDNGFRCRRFGGWRGRWRARGPSRTRRPSVVRWRGGVRRLQPGRVRERHEEALQLGAAGARLVVKATVVEGGIAVRDSVAEAHRVAQDVGQFVGDDLVVGESVEGRSRVVGRWPAGVGHPVTGEIDAVLDGELEIERGQVAPGDVGEELLPRPVSCLSTWRSRTVALAILRARTSRSPWATFSRRRRR